jgi:pimeloyl-ACP methyl ester carboxylesterase
VSLGVAEPERIGSVLVAGGRRLGFAEWGPPDGEPVLFFSGAAMGRRLGFGSDVVHDLGVRLVTLERPGIGVSDPVPDRTLGDWAADVGELTSTLGFDTPAAVAFSQGAPFGFACAVAGTVRGLASVSGQDEFHDPVIRALSAPEIASLVDAVAIEPSEVERSFATMTTADAMWALVTETSSPVDQSIYTSAEFAPAYRQSLDDGLATGAGGYARDLVLAFGSWTFAVEDIAVPVHLWYGALDASPVHSPDRGARLASRLPDARHHIVDGAGSALLWTGAAEILAELLGP